MMTKQDAVKIGGLIAKASAIECSKLDQSKAFIVGTPAYHARLSIRGTALAALDEVWYEGLPRKLQDQFKASDVVPGNANHAHIAESARLGVLTGRAVFVAMVWDTGR